MRVLYTSAEIHDEIKRIFTRPKKNERRVALVAYVGEQAEAFLPDPPGLTVICALEPGSTSPDVLDRLNRRGATVMSSERLHMKVYWSSLRGCVICSAN